jgi:predicted phosphodiesterase
LPAGFVGADSIRIFSDIHFGDRSSRVRQLEQLRPLFDDIDRVVLNGDTLDTRPSPRPEHTLECRRAVDAFVRSSPAPVTLLTGNHDPDITTKHMLELAGGQVLVLHGDILFEEIVPWGRDAAIIRERIGAQLGGRPEGREKLTLEQRLDLWRNVAVTIPQRHQSEPHGLKYALRFAADTVWPPTRVLRVLAAWRAEPVRAAALVRQHRPAARFLVLGHTHRPAIWRLDDQRVIINAGSFCPPFGGYAIEVKADRLVVRHVVACGGEFRPDATVAEFALAPH